MTIDDRDASRLQLRGDAVSADVHAVLEAAVLVLDASTSRLVVDVRGVTSAGASLVTLLNDLAAHAASLRRTLSLEVPDDAAWLASASLHPAIQVERTSLLQVARTRRPAAVTRGGGASDGVARRDGRGFVASYGERRPCARSGCSTTLSRYNSGALCGLHGSDTPGGRVGQPTVGDYI
jgi:hypothetical protein